MSREKRWLRTLPVGFGGPKGTPAGAPATMFPTRVGHAISTDTKSWNAWPLCFHFVFAAPSTFEDLSL
jgi:hypothetical protein